MQDKFKVGEVYEFLDKPTGHHTIFIIDTIIPYTHGINFYYHVIWDSFTSNLSSKFGDHSDMYQHSVPFTGNVKLLKVLYDA